MKQSILVGAQLVHQMWGNCPNVCQPIIILATSALTGACRKTLQRAHRHTHTHNTHNDDTHNDDTHTRTNARTHTHKHAHTHTHTHTHKQRCKLVRRCITHTHALRSTQGDRNTRTPSVPFSLIAVMPRQKGATAHYKQHMAVDRTTA
jgi:ABC-type Zn2+ transport system substrate-binding protein/surface adhesin